MNEGWELIGLTQEERELLIDALKVHAFFYPCTKSDLAKEIARRLEQQETRR